jgi:hypothetical protein
MNFEQSVKYGVRVFLSGRMNKNEFCKSLSELANEFHQTKEKTIELAKQFHQELSEVKNNKVTEKNFKYIETQMIDQNGTHVSLYTEYCKYFVGYRKEMHNTFWNTREYTSLEEAKEKFQILVNSELASL